ncbi:MAG: MFS transporter [Crocinitomicaceae bacterium]|nr:MFS transporter [Crocinitomicaceae bacterium]
MEKGNKKIIRGWVMYDWANSVYNLVISSAIFPIFYDNETKKQWAKDKLEMTNDSYAQVFEDDKKFDFASITSQKLAHDEIGMSAEAYNALPAGFDFGNVTVDFFGATLSNSVLMSYVLAASFILVSILSPMLSGVADFSGNKKRFMQFFCYLGAISCMSLFFFTEVPIEVAMISIFIASIGFWNSLVFYNAYLPEIAEPKDHDSISARGFSMGYFGSMLLLIICLALIMGIGSHMTKYCFIFVGVWWMIFSQFTYRVLPNNPYKKKKQKGILTKGFKELRIVFKEFKKIKKLKRFLLAFFFYNTGVQTVMLMAVIFAKKEVNWGDAGGDSGLIIAILLIQILGAVGAFVMSILSSYIGNIRTLGISVMIWIVVCAAAYLVITPMHFYFLASAVGLVMGGVQALSRSTYSKFLPETEDHASYFSFFDAAEKIGIVVGLISFGLFEMLTGSIRYSVISVAFFFIIGLILLFFVPREKLKKSKS